MSDLTPAEILDLIDEEGYWQRVDTLYDSDVLLDPQYEFNLQASDLAMEWAEGEGLLVVNGGLLIDNPGHEFEKVYILARGGELVEYSDWVP